MDACTAASILNNYDLSEPIQKSIQHLVYMAQVSDNSEPQMPQHLYWNVLGGGGGGGVEKRRGGGNWAHFEMLFHYIPAVLDLTTVSTQCEACPSCSTSTALASVITAIATALLATVIFVLVMIAVCKCHPKFTPGGAEIGTSAGGSMRRWMEVGEV